MAMNGNTELRKLPVARLSNIINVLETNSDWKKVMSIIPMDLQSDMFQPKYNNEDIRMIEEHAKATNQKCAEILFDEWGTSGRIRPTLSTLKDILMQAEIYRAADEIAFLLKETPPPRPAIGPAALIDTNVTQLLENESMEMRLNATDTVKREVCNRTTVQMKSESNMIKFSKTLPSMGLDSDKKPVDQIESYSDLIKFSTKQCETMNIPNLSIMLSENETNLSQINNSTSNRSPTDVESSISESISYNNQSGVESYPEDYQHTFPNIEISCVDSAILEDTNLINFEYQDLEKVTKGFSESNVIGRGGFGEVYIANHPKLGTLAVKRINYSKPNIAMNVFNSEVGSLSQFRHPNIVPILGFSINGPTQCIVCEYINGGSLLDKIAARVLTEKQRISIMMGTAEGLKYLHTSQKHSSSKESCSLPDKSNSDSQTSTKNFVHGDVKSANILLTDDLVPKLCDFGLAKQYDATFIRSTSMGTSAYMSPEGRSGTITQKIDVFSYGIVLLELLTGLRPIVAASGEVFNIKDYVMEYAINNDISNLLDPVVEWTKANDLYDLAQNCLEENRNQRPTIIEVCDTLHKISD